MFVDYVGPPCPSMPYEFVPDFLTMTVAPKAFRSWPFSMIHMFIL